MTDLVGRILAVLFDASLAATAISGLVVLVMVQSRQPARRLGWARAGLLATATLIPLAALNPVPPIDVGHLIHLAVPSGWDDPGPSQVRPDRRDAFLPDPDGVCPPGSPAGGRSGGWGRLRKVAEGLLLAYGLGVTFGLGRSLLGLWGLAFVAGRGRPASAATVALYEGLPFGSERPKPRLVVSDRMTRPVLAGLIRPKILLPPESERPSAATGLRLSLLHELAHAESNDHIATPLAGLVQSAWFFLPPIWWIRDQMKMDQEFLADRRAVAHFGNSGGYASSLVELASVGPAEADRPGGDRSARGSPPSRASALFQRVAMLLKCPFAIENHPPLWWRRSAAATITLATLAASCLSFRGLAPSPAAEESSAIRPARAFRIADLAITPSGNDQPFDLRFRLPATFTLNLEIMADPADLRRIEILHHPLDTADNIDPAQHVYRLWHKVTIRRHDGRDEVVVDGKPIREPGDSGKPAPWLTIQPVPGGPTRIRDLSLDW